MPSRPLTTSLLLTIALSTALAGCGRRGPLEPPATTVAPSSDKTATDKGRTAKSAASDHPFLLDRLIQ